MLVGGAVSQWAERRAHADETKASVRSVGPMLRVEDAEFGVTCYLPRSTNGIFCIRTPSTP